MSKNVTAKLWTLPASGGRRYSNGAPPPSGPWADEFITDVADIGAAMVTPGVRVGVTVGANFTGLSQQLTPGNGASMDIVAGGSFDGEENAVRIYPPSTEVVQYASWLRNLDIWNNGATNIPQLNFRWIQYFGPTYYLYSAPTKLHGVFCQNVLSASPPGGAIRQAVWEDQNTSWSPWKYWGTTSTSVQYYPGFSIDEVADSEKLMQIGGSPAHANSPPRVGGEFVCMETVVDLRQNRGNAFGMNKLVVWTRDGVVSARSIQSPCNWWEGWDFNYQYISGFEGLGFYWNTFGEDDPGNFVTHTHATFCQGMGINELIGPPPGFLL